MNTTITALKKKVALGAANTVFFLNCAFANTMVAAASGSKDPDLNKVTKPIIGLLNTVFTALIWVVAAVGAVFCISLGVKYARAEEPQEREKAKTHLKNAIIGFVLIFVLVVALRILTPEMVKWVGNNSTPTGTGS